MAVLAEAISVIVRRDAIKEKYAGGWEGFVRAIPNATLCSDNDIARVGFMTPLHVRAFIRHLEAHGLRHLMEDICVDIAVVDQQRGLTTRCDWLEFAQFPFGSGKVSVCWFFDGPRIAAGIHMPRGWQPGELLEFSTPPGWRFEGSLSEKFVFVPLDKINESLRFLRTERGNDVYLHLETSKEIYHPAKGR